LFYKNRLCIKEFVKSFELWNNFKMKKIVFYEGYKDEEIPRKFEYMGKEVIVKDIISSGYMGSTDPEGPTDRFFEVRGNDEKIYRIFYISSIEEWIILEKA
jgi:hypothetical protein